MQEKQLNSKYNGTGQISWLNNTGYRRTYHKSDKVNSCYFNTGCSNEVNNAPIHSLGIQVPPDVTDIELWLLSKISEAGYSSWETYLPTLVLPVDEAIVLDCNDESVFKNAIAPYNLVKDAVILSKCSHTKYDPGSPMIFSHKRINRAISFVTINLESFYELD